MKHKVLSIALAAMALLTSCEKDLMSYEGKECLYFDVRRGASWIAENLWAHQYYSVMDFGNMVQNDSVMSLKIMATGNLKDYDRSFRVIVNADSTTAVAGTDYSGLEESYVIKAGETSTEVKLAVHRTEAMNGDTIRLQLKIVPNEFFDTKFDVYGDFPNTYDADANKAFDGNKDASVHNLFFFDVLSRPSGWFGNDDYGSGLFGKYSAKKYKYMMQVTNTTIEDFQSDKMPSQRANAISQTVAKELLQQAENGTPVIDEDGTMMWVMYVNTLGGDKAWAAFTKPEDYYKN